MPHSFGLVTPALAAFRIQVAFPQVYLACHTRHQRKRSTPHRLSARDASILSHLDPVRYQEVGTLATHLGVARSTCSEALKRLVALGFAERGPGRGAVRLSATGQDAIRDTSVLETEALEAVLATLDPRQRASACRGLEVLARACRASRRTAR